jgi:hypothetical protein
MSFNEWSLHQTPTKYAYENLSVQDVDGRRCSSMDIEATFDELNNANDVAIIAYTIG